MKIFISWSGERTKKVAEVLKEWIMQVIQATDAWISVDIEKGSRWSSEISRALSESKVAIICLDKDNIDSNWIHFEAGAVAKTEDAMVCTLLLDVKSTDLKQPLSAFQNTLFKKEDVRKLMHDINKKLEKNGSKPLVESVLDKLFDKNWDDLEGQVSAILKSKVDTKKSERTDRELMEEILQEIRAIKGEGTLSYFSNGSKSFDINDPLVYSSKMPTTINAYDYLNSIRRMPKIKVEDVDGSGSGNSES